jgi:hypothetical protein
LSSFCRGRIPCAAAELFLHLPGIAGSALMLECVTKNENYTSGTISASFAFLLRRMNSACPRRMETAPTGLQLTLTDLQLTPADFLLHLQKRKLQ